MAQIIRAAESKLPHPNAVGVLLAAHLRLRRGEIGALSWDRLDLDSDTPTIAITEGITDAGVERGGILVGGPKTEASVRTLPLPPRLPISLREARKGG